MNAESETAGSRGSQSAGLRRLSSLSAWLAWFLWGLSVPITTFSGLLAFRNASAQAPDSEIMIVLAFLVLMFTSVGALVASRCPENPIGWIFCSGGLVLGVAVFATAYANYSLGISSELLPGGQYAAWVSGWASFPTVFLVATMLFLLFPDGRLPSRPWRLVAWTAIISSVLLALGEALGRDNMGTDLGSIANPVVIGGAIGNFLQMMGGFGLTFLILSCLASIASSFLRLSQASGQERQQLKWFVYAAAIMSGGFLGAFTLGSSELMWEAGMLMGLLGFTFLPVAVGFAIFKYRLYDIDIVINRTLVYGTLTAMLVIVYFTGATLLGGAFRALTGQGSQPSIVVSTLVIAALFNPLRRRIQAFIDRRFYRRKYDAARTLEEFSAKLRDETDLEDLRNDLVSVVRETMQPEYVSLWIRSPGWNRGPEG